MSSNRRLREGRSRTKGFESNDRDPDRDNNRDLKGDRKKEDKIDKDRLAKTKEDRDEKKDATKPREEKVADEKLKSKDEKKKDDKDERTKGDKAKDDKSKDEKGKDEKLKDDKKKDDKGKDDKGKDDKNKDEKSKDDKKKDDRKGNLDPKKKDEKGGDEDADSKLALYRALANELESFSEKKVRSLFVVKVLSLLTCMLMITTSIVVIVTISTTMQLFLLENYFIAMIAMAMLVGISVALGHSQVVRKNFPVNYSLLLTMTLSQAVLLSYVVAMYETRSVLIALLTTCATTGTIATLSASSKWDLTQYSSQIGITVGMFLCVQILTILVVPEVDFIDQVLGGIGALLFSMYIASDVQMLLGNQRFRLEPEDYIGAVIALYLDIINMFTSVLRLWEPKEVTSR